MVARLKAQENAPKTSFPSTSLISTTTSSSNPALLAEGVAKTKFLGCTRDAGRFMAPERSRISAKMAQHLGLVAVRAGFAGRAARRARSAEIWTDA